MGRATLNDALQEGLELIKGSAISTVDLLQYRRVLVHDIAVLLDRLNRIRRRPHSLIGNRRIELREIDQPHRLGTEDEWIVPFALLVDFQLNGKCAYLVQARRSVGGNAPVKKAHRCEVSRVLKCRPERNDAGGAAVIVLRRPVILSALAGLNWRKRDVLITHERVGLQTLLQGGEIGQGLQ